MASIKANCHLFSAIDGWINYVLEEFEIGADAAFKHVFFFQNISLILDNNSQEMRVQEFPIKTMSL